MKKAAKYIICITVILSFMLYFTACSGKKEASSQEAVQNTPQNAAPQQTVNSNGTKNITTQELKEKIGQDGWIVVDTRINDAFNGWKIDGIKRGGHIKGATDFSANWITADVKDRDKKLQDALKIRGITPDKNVVLYDANGKDSKIVADYLMKQGFKNIYVYNVNEWAKDDSLAMESYPNYRMIVPAEWINDLINGKNPETYNGSRYKIFEVSWGKVSKEYNSGHIPGAVHINTDEVEEGPLWNRLSDKGLEKFALNNGITVDTTVVLYGADSAPAYRVAAILKYMGVRDVRVLNGGYVAWTKAGYAQETRINAKDPVKAFGAEVPVNKRYIIDMPEAKEILADKNGSRLVDIRSWDEHIGKISGYDYIKEKGRPAGSVWGHDLPDYRNIDGTMLNGSLILSMWKEWGITPDKRLSFFCGTGWRAAEVLTYADVMGLKNISLYDGGWNEWTIKKDKAVEVGEPVKPTE